MIRVFMPVIMFYNYCEESLMKGARNRLKTAWTGAKDKIPLKVRTDEPVAVPAPVPAGA